VIDRDIYLLRQVHPTGSRPRSSTAHFVEVAPPGASSGMRGLAGVSRRTHRATVAGMWGTLDQTGLLDRIGRLADRL
jgi:hypothetical protein